MSSNLNNDSQKEITIKDRVKLLRKIHLLKVAENVDLTDIRKDRPIPKASEIFSEKECWKCGKVGKLSLCKECKQLLKGNAKLDKPEIQESFVVDIENLLCELLKNSSMFVTFSREMVLGIHVSDWTYMQSFMKYSRNMIISGMIEKIAMRGMSSYKLTLQGIRYFSKLVETAK